MNSVSRLRGEAQSDVMAGCNECFPVGWTVTLWMAGAWRPEGERERGDETPPAVFESRLFTTDLVHSTFGSFFLGRFSL